MKIVRTASGKQTVKISKSEWQSIGKTAGWISAEATSLYTTINYPLTVKMKTGGGEVTYDISVSIEITEVVNEGKGPYEYWGDTGVDKGSDYIQDFEVKDVESNEGIEFSDETKQKIIAILENDEKFAEKVYSLDPNKQ